MIIQRANQLLNGLRARRWWRIFLAPFGVSVLGIVLGSICFFTSLTPSLVPRSGLLQGVLAGCCFAAGYGVGVGVKFIWTWLGLPRLDRTKRNMAIKIAIGTAVAFIVAGLVMAAHWQQDVHTAMGLPPVETVRPFTIAGVAGAVAIVLLSIGRVFRAAVQVSSKWLAEHLPQKVALLASLVATIAAFVFIGGDVIIGGAFTAFDKTYARIDATLPDDGLSPSDPLATGSPASLIDWSSMGAEGRAFVSQGPDAPAISAITDRPALQPLRIYVGMGSAETAAERARLALNEAIRVGAFERDALVIATPTGTGWMDPSSHFPLEVLLDGDVATVGVQYSYLPSWLSLLAVPEYGAESARAVFLAFHDYWSRLPEDTRPKLYLFGLSLGAMNTDLSYDFYDVVDAPMDGVFMSGPPFTSRGWGQLTRDRDAGSAAWLPRFRNGEVVRFMNQDGIPPQSGEWGSTRILYLQYATDGIVFFSPSLIWQRPEWLDQPRGPGVSPRLRWVPIVTFLQVGFDLLTATTTPSGQGHVYAGVDYMTGWNAMLGTDRSSQEKERLKRAMAANDL
ncbi:MULTISPECIES: alpha/beta hydrolase [unclassified Brevundimonas]|uniref:alpha/beta hydrolase n=1 Tax=unclassified Brevundimonas TaxID=2622653 RepID=UPI0025C701D2|nr:MULTISPECIES: alpha/beta-hydrolase family protein [unclassified Brevundimonas]